MIIFLLVGLLQCAVSQTNECSLETDGSGYYNVEGRDDLVMRHVINEVDSTVTIELTYTGLAWIGFAFVTQPSMVPSIALLGLPEYSGVAKYNMTAKSPDGVTLITDNAMQQESITDGSIVQNDTHTVMTFTRPLIEDPSFNEVDVTASASNMFIWAVGTENSLGYHASRGDDNIQLDSICGGGGTTGDGDMAMPSTTTDTAASPSTSPVSQGSTAIGGRFDGTIKVSDDVNARLVTDPTLKTITVEMTYAGIDKWIAFAFSKNGEMIDSTAIIGVQPSTDGTTLPAKYDMTSKTSDGVTLASSDRQATLSDLELYQNDTHTYMKFTKPLIETDQTPPVFLDGTTNNFLYAIGSGPDLGLHSARAAFKFVLQECDPTQQDCTNNVEIDSTVPNQNMWIAHGICMGLAWVIFIPIGVGSSLIRKLISPEPSASKLWFEIHRGLNMIGIVLTIIGFSIGVATYNGTHFSSQHTKAGLAIFILAVFQGVNGILRPHPPQQHQQGTAAATATEPKDDDDDAEDNEKNTNNDTNHSEEKSPARTGWEILHRLIGVATLGLAWYNCSTGVDLYEILYGDDYSTVLWGLVGGIGGTIAVLTVVSKVMK